MAKILKESTVKQHKAQGKVYFQTGIPLPIAVDVLGLARDKKKQRLEWIVKEGKVVVKTATQEVEIGPGDFVTFPRGLDCTWSVSKSIRKHYKFKP